VIALSIEKMPAPATSRLAWLKTLGAWLAPPAGDPELAHAQLGVLARQIPLLFIILNASALVLAATHLRCAPAFLTIVMPCLFCVACALRVRYWRRLDLAAIDGPGALARMKTTLVSVAILGAVFTAWALALFPYGDAYARCHVAFYMAITVISCILCLTHLRGAALLLTAIVVIPFTIFFVGTGNPVLIGMTINFVLVAAGLIVLMLHNYDDFAGRVGLQRVTQRLSDENFRLAQLDSLTLLPNRGRFFAELDGMITAAGQSGAAFAVAIIDLDRFKAVNDIYGHAAGDRLLQQVGQRLASIAAEKIFIARLGGDEFGAILKTASDEAAITTFGTRVKTLLEPAFTLSPGCLASIGCSIGAARYPQTGQTAEQLFERADYALYDAKQFHPGTTIVFSQKLETRIRQSSRIEQALRTADLEAELSLAFQPIVEIETGQTIAFESLARWNSQTLGPVSPAVFIPIAEHCQLISPITKILFAKMLGAVSACPAPMRFGFNLSAHDICSRETMADIHALIQQSGVSCARLTFEITEGALLQDFDLAAEMIDSLKHLGARIALDDFGVGFSSLGYVQRLKPDRIKIDRSFVTAIEDGDTAPSIIRAIVDLCRHLDVGCVIEGVETASQLAILRGLGARFVQGYHFSKPLPFAAIAPYLAAAAAAAAPALPTPSQRRRTMLTS
jgi:diguanylate cyclase (GGDEF)-like protein